MAPSLLRHGSILSILTLVSRILGLFREMTKAALLGTTALSDAFSVAFMIPNLFRRLFAEGSISVAFIPTFKEYLQHNDEESIFEFLSCFFTVLIVLVSFVVAAGIIFTPELVSFFKMGAFDETVLLTRFMFPFLALVSLASLFQGILNSVYVFAPSGFAPIILNVVTIVCAYLLSRWTENPARAMAIGIVAGGALEALVQLPFVVKKGFYFSFTGLKRAFCNLGVKKVLRLIVPTIIGMAAYQLNDLVSTALAGNVGAGVVSSLQYSLRLQELILGVFAVSIGTVLLPRFAEHAQSGDWESYNRQLLSSVQTIILITVPITFFAVANGDALIRLLFQSRTFNEESVSLTVNAFNFHILGLLFIALNRILAPAFYAQSDSRSPTLAGIISFVVNMILAVILSGPFRGGGIAAALSLASAVNTVFLFLFLKRNSKIHVGDIIRTALFYTGKIALFSGIALIPVLLCRGLFFQFAESGRIVRYGLPLLITTILYAIIGLFLLFVTKDLQVRSLVSLFRKKT
ncbi:putative lipid II flippase MurJ [Spirochaetia bacterium]|nr:putative lipid II flippase MurJ [Spirochaetia bacterium]